MGGERAASVAFETTVRKGIMMFLGEDKEGGSSAGEKFREKDSIREPQVGGTGCRALRSYTEFSPRVGGQKGKG